jgi:hypothetical protein
VRPAIAVSGRPSPNSRQVCFVFAAQDGIEVGVVSSVATSSVLKWAPLARVQNRRIDAAGHALRLPGRVRARGS